MHLSNESWKTELLLAKNQDVYVRVWTFKDRKNRKGGKMKIKKRNMTKVSPAGNTKKWRVNDMRLFPMSRLICMAIIKHLILLLVFLLVDIFFLFWFVYFLFGHREKSIFKDSFFVKVISGKSMKAKKGIESWAASNNKSKLGIGFKSQIDPI